MKYIHDNEVLEAELEQDGKVGPLVITVVTKKPTSGKEGQRLHISNPTVEDDGNYTGGEIIARVVLPPIVD